MSRLRKTPSEVRRESRTQQQTCDVCCSNQPPSLLCELAAEPNFIPPRATNVAITERQRPNCRIINQDDSLSRERVDKLKKLAHWVWPFALLTVFAFMLPTTVPGISGAIACYRCQSRNNSNRDCDDPFHTFDNHSGQIVNLLDRNCMGSRKDRYGPFPAVACVKVAGYVLDSGEWLTLRSCAGDSGETTSDTEIVRQNHCGTFRYENEYLRGCIMSCYEDGCNAASSFVRTRRRQHIVSWFFAVFFVAITVVFNRCYVAWGT